MIRAGEGVDPISIGFAVLVGGCIRGTRILDKKETLYSNHYRYYCFIGYMGLVILTNTLVDGSVGLLKGIFSGIIIKVIILVNLILPIKDAKELQEVKKIKF